MSLIYKEENSAIVGACLEVFHTRGPCFLESVYDECLEVEFMNKTIPFKANPKLSLSYKGKKLTDSLMPDFVCYDKIVVQVESVRKLAEVHRARLFNCMKTGDYKLGLLVNFGVPSRLIWERIVATPEGSGFIKGAPYKRISPFKIA